MENKEEYKFENNLIYAFVFIVSMIVITYCLLGNDFGNGMTLIAIIGFVGFIVLILFIKSMFHFAKFIEFVIKH